jgi:glutamyl-tRNA synthetase
LIEKFSLEAVGKSAAAINPGKLDWLNGQYIKSLDPEELVRMMKPFIEAKGYSGNDADLSRKAFFSLRERVKTLVEMADVAEFYFSEKITYDEKAAQKFLTRETIPVLEEIIASLTGEMIWDKEHCHGLVHHCAEARGEPLVKVAQPLRVALTGRTASPPIDEVMEILGKERVVRRLRAAIEYIKKS